MIKTEINVPFDTLKNCYHVSDIHIRNLKRHKEYNEVFNELYKEIQNDIENSIIVVTGDIAHAKTDMSPELVSMISKFLSNLASIAPTLVITGNHDCNLNNPNRLDVLEPIIETINHSNLHYLKDSGIYTLADTDFIVFSVFDTPEQYISADIVPGDRTKIALYHGIVDGIILDSGMVMNTDKVTLKHFEGYDIGMLGDIHKHQYLNKQKTIGYASSLIQQNHGEDYKNHGIIKWNIPKRKGTFIPIHNNYGFYTLYIKDNNLPDIDDLPKNPRLRIRIQNTLMSDVKQILADIKKKYRVRDVVVNVVDSDKVNNLDYDTSDSIIGNINDVTHQNKLITDYLDNHYHEVDKTVLKNVIEINNKLNQNLKQKEINIGAHWRLKSLEFSNLFSYGENNYIDFETLEGVQGLFAPNSSGKSSLMDVILFGLYDKCSRAFKPSDMVNTRKKSFHLLINFELNGEDYYIEKSGKKRRKKFTKGNETVAVKTDFWKEDDMGNTISLNAEDRRYTNEVIKEYIGTIDNATLTSFSLQNNNTGLISKSNSERKQLLSSFLGIDIFEQLFEKAHAESKEIQVLLKEFMKKDLDTQLADFGRIYDSNKLLYEKGVSSLDSLNKKKKRYENSLIEWNKKLVEVEEIDDTLSLRDLKSNLSQIKITSGSLDSQLKSNHKSLDTIKTRATKLGNKAKNYNETDINDKHVKLIQTETKLTKVEHEVEKLELHLTHQKDKMNKYDYIEYDPECEYCMKNVNQFFSDAADIREEYRTESKQLELKKQEFDGLKKLISTLDPYRKKLEVLQQIQQFKVSLKEQFTQIKNAITVLDHKVEINRNEIKEAQDKIDKYYKNRSDIENNKKVQSRIDEIEQLLETLEGEIISVDAEAKQYYTRMEVAKNNQENILKQMKEAEEYELKYQAYDYYLKAVHRNGIPHELIKKVIPIFQTEINNILTQLAEFTILVDIDDKYIDFRLTDNDDYARPLGLGGGMEKFISSIAIRNALIRISNKPKPNFLFIDEGWANLDSNNLSQLYILFNYLKSQYELILIISHIDAMRDIIDQLLSISKINGYSHIDNR